jgi:hypothetical protein
MFGLMFLERMDVYTDIVIQIDTRRCDDLVINDDRKSELEKQSDLPQYKHIIFVVGYQSNQDTGFIYTASIELRS